jgi:isopenicillin-N epimerase
MTLVDGAHALGLLPLDLATLGADFYVANAHKWLMGPPGGALLYVAPALRRLLVPLVTTAYAEVPPGREEESVGYGGPARWQFAHEYQGTRDLTPLLAVPAAVDFHAQVGLAAMTERSRALAALCRERLTALGHAPVSPAHPELATSMTTFTVPAPGGKPIDHTKAWWQMRARHGIEVLFPFLMDGTVLLRVSTAWFNTASDVERLTEALAAFDWNQSRA